MFVAGLRRLTVDLIPFETEHRAGRGSGVVPVTPVGAFKRRPRVLSLAFRVRVGARDKVGIRASRCRCREM